MKMNLKSVETKWTENESLGMGEGAVWRKTSEKLERGKVRVRTGRHGCVSQCENLSNVVGIKDILTLSLLI